MYDWLHQANLLVTCMLVGLIWTIQLVHYPSFIYVDPDTFVAFERFHTVRISIIVIPLMLCELVVAGGLIHISGYTLNTTVPFILVVLIWFSTAVLSVPCHRKLAMGKDTAVITRLVNTNWLRTILWTAKGIILCVW